MIKEDADTICAIDTATGRGGIALSGYRAESSIERITDLPYTRLATFVDMMNSNCELIDSGIALYPRPTPSRAKCWGTSGSRQSEVLQSPLEQCIAQGARLAAPESLPNERS